MEINTDNVVKQILGDGIKLTLIGSDLPIQLPQNLPQVIILVISILPTVIFILSVAMVMIGALKWAKSNGNEKELEKGQKTIKNAIFGFIAMFLFFMLSNLISFLLVGFSVASAFYALAPCGSKGFVYNVLQEQNAGATVPGAFNFTDENLTVTYGLCKTGFYK